MDLEARRQELGDVDRQLIELIGRRQRIAAEIGRLKHDQGVPTRDFRQERVVLERAGDTARRAGVEAEVVVELMKALIDSSLTVQERDRIEAMGGGSGKRALVIGGHGRMGAWMARFLDSQGYTVEIADPAGPLPGFSYLADYRASDLKHDVIVVAVPLGFTNDVLLELVRRRPAGLIFDIASLKGPLSEGLLALRDAGLTVTSLHPMFGPATQLLSGRHVIFIDLGDDGTAIRRARELFASTMATLIDMPLEEHDTLISFVLGLSHALNIAFFTALAESGEAAPKLAELSSTTFDSQLAVATQVASENPALYYEIQALNKHSSASLTALRDAVERIRAIVDGGSKDDFVVMMERGRAYLAGRRAPA